MPAQYCYCLLAFSHGIQSLDSRHIHKIGSIVFGWIFGGGDLDKLSRVKDLARHYGMAFQVADDLGDIHQDCEQQKQVNYAVMLGVGCALERVRSELAAYREGLEGLGIASPGLLAIADLIENRLPTGCLT